MSMRRIGRAGAAVAVAAGCALIADVALAGMGQPSPRQLGLQEPATEIARNINSLHNILLWIISLITAFVLILLLWVMFRYNEKANPTPTKTAHNATVEVLWTVIPIFILGAIALPSIRLLYQQYEFPKADVTIKAIGHQWYWTHEYVDAGVKFDSVMIKDEDVLKREHGEARFNELYGKLGELERMKRMHVESAKLWEKNKLVRMLSVDNEVVLPVNKVVHVLVTADDVIHNWTIPSFGSKIDAVPGRVTATWFKAEKKGMFYGQCSELCGKDHGSMPIAVRIVDEPVYKEWLAATKARDRKKAREIIEKAEAADMTKRDVASVDGGRS